MTDHKEGYGNPAICQLTGQVMAHRAALIALGRILKKSGALDQSDVTLLRQHLAAQANAVLDEARKLPDASRVEHDGNHIAAGFETEAQAIIDGINP